MKPLLDQISQLVPRLPGWCSIEKAHNLATIICALKPSLTVEIGVFGGRSFLPMVLAHKFINHGMAIGVEPWSNAVASEGYEQKHTAHWAKVDMAKIESQFRSELAKINQEGRVLVQKLRSDVFTPPKRIDLLHIDGQHTEQSVKDITRFDPYINIGGIVVLDDLNWDNYGRNMVEGAAKWMLERGHYRELYRVLNKPAGVDDYGVFQKVK